MNINALSTIAPFISKNHHAISLLGTCMLMAALLIALATMAVVFGVRAGRLRRERDELYAKWQDLGWDWAGADIALEETTARLNALEAWVRKQPIGCYACGAMYGEDRCAVTGDDRGDLSLPSQVGEKVTFTCYDCANSHPLADVLGDGFDEADAREWIDE